MADLRESIAVMIILISRIKIVIPASPPYGGRVGNLIITKI